MNWSPAEDAIIRDHYPKIGAKGVGELLPTRRFRGIKARASRLGVQKGSHLRWTKEMERSLAELYPTMTASQLVNVFKARYPYHDFNVEKIYSRAQDLRLKKLHPWTPEELGHVRRESDRLASYLERLIPRRSRQAIESHIVAYLWSDKRRRVLMLRRVS